MSHLSIKILTIAILLGASFNLVGQFYRMHRERTERQELSEYPVITVCKFGPAVHEVSRLFIELLLMLAFAGSLMRGLKNTLLSVAALTGVTILYVFWWQHYFWLAEVLGSELAFVDHVAYLTGAGYLDLIIAIAIALLILLHLRLAVRSMLGQQVVLADSTNVAALRPLAAIPSLDFPIKSSAHESLH